MKLFLAAAGDGISNLLQQAMLLDNPEEIRRIAASIETGNKIFESFALSTGGSTIESSPLFLLIEIAAADLKSLEVIKKQYKSATNTTVSVGIGHKTSEACKALKVAQLKGCNHSVFYTGSVEKELKEKLEKADNKKAADADVIDLNTMNTPALPQTQATVASAVNNDAVPLPGQPLPGVEAQAPEEAQPVNFEQAFREHATKQDESERAQKLKTSESYQEIKQKVAEALVNVKNQMPAIAQLRSTAPDAYEAIIGVIQGIIAIGRELSSTDEKIEKNLTFTANPIEDTNFDTSVGILEASEADPTFDLEQVAIGAQVEMEEHGLTLERATKIAKDHLKEDPGYYKRETREAKQDLNKTEGFQYDGPADGEDKKHYFVNPLDNTKWLFQETAIPAEAYAAEAASRLAVVLKDVHKRHPVKSYQMVGRVGTIEPAMGLSDLGQVPPQHLTQAEKADVLTELLIDWLMGNPGTGGKQLLRTMDGRILGSSKVDTFKDFTNIGPYYTNLLDSYKAGSLTLDLSSVLPILDILDSISDDDYWLNIGQYAQEMYPDNTEAQIQFALKVMTRKRNAREQFVELLKASLSKGERPEYGKMRGHIKGGILVNLPVGSQVEGKVKVRHWDGLESWKSIKSGAILGLDPGVAGEGHPVSSKNPGAR